MRGYQVISSCGALFWIMARILIISSLRHSLIAAYINLAIGIIFALFGFFLFIRAKLFLLTMKSIRNKHYSNTKLANYVNKLFLTEMILNLLNIFVVLAMLSGVVFRVFIEKKPVFG